MAEQDSLPIYEPEGKRLSIDNSGRARLDSVSGGSGTVAGASLAGPVPRYRVQGSRVVHPATLSGMGGTMPMASLPPSRRPENRKPTPDELEAWAQQMTEALEKDLDRPAAVQNDGQGVPDWLRNYMAPGNDARMERTR